MFAPLYTAEEMKAAEAGHDVDALMERAGRAVAEAVLAHYPDARRIALLCGRGANGGDARIAGELLRGHGKDVEEGGPALGAAEVVVDGLIGTGLREAPRPEAAASIEAVNRAAARVVAVDIPSGVNASTGETPGAAVRADVTVTFHAPKVGHVVAPGRYLCGELVVADIGLGPRETRNALVTPAVLAQVPRKREQDNKYTAGSLLVVGGSPGMTGAAALAARAAFRADAGYVALAAPSEALSILETVVLEAVKLPLESAAGAAERASALALGPGLGREHGELVRALLTTDLPAVLDADALHGLEPFERAAPTVLTPHSGELARLLGTDSEWVDAHRLEALHRAVDRYACVVVLKGADTLVGAPGQGALVQPEAAPQLATAGTGDVLTGVLAAFLAKGMEPRLAAAAAVVAHAGAAALAGEVGVVAGDVVDALPRVFDP